MKTEKAASAVRSSKISRPAKLIKEAAREIKVAWGPVPKKMASKRVVRTTKFVPHVIVNVVLPDDPEVHSFLFPSRKDADGFVAEMRKHGGHFGFNMFEEMALLPEES
jgi:hypothetical protein